MNEQAAVNAVSFPPAQAYAGTGHIVAQPIASVTAEKFIPVDRNDVVRQAIEKIFEPRQRALAAKVLRYMCILRQAESAKSLDKLVELYDAFNPDDETVNLAELTGAERQAQLEELKATVADLVSGANYIEIDRAELENLLSEESGIGFRAEVDLDEYDFHLLYYRGAIKQDTWAREWKRLWLFKKFTKADAYRRLFIGLKLKPAGQRVEELMAAGMGRRKAVRQVRRARNQQMLEGVNAETLHLKVFRMIARSEMQILFPNARISFTLFDKLWLWIGSGGGTLFAIGMAAVKFIFAVVITPVVFLLTVAGAVGAVFRTVTSFFNTRTRYMAKLAKSLYFHNIGSNESVLTLLTDEAEEEDIMEAVLTYALLLKHGHRGLNAVKHEAEAFLRDEFKVETDFDITDGCDHLRKLGLLVEDDDGHPRIRDLEDALQHMTAEWQAIPASA